MRTKQSDKIRLPYGWNQAIQLETGYSASTVTNEIQAGNTSHEVWKAYERLLGEKEALKREERARVEKAAELHRQLMYA
jgi:hypothetical protein